MIHLIILSKDRPCQCDLTLSSVFHNDTQNLFSKISILYTASTKEFNNGYAILKNRWKYHIHFCKEEEIGGFKPGLLDLVNDESEFVCFATDDDILYREIPKLKPTTKQAIKSLFRTNNPNISCFSLRLGVNCIIQDPYCNSRSQMPPKYIQNDSVRLWDTRTITPYQNHSYILSVDAHIFETNTLLPLLQKNGFNYTNPNSLEGGLQQYTHEISPYMASFNKSCVVNTPINRVQNTCCNKAGLIYGISPKYLNEQFLLGKRLSLSEMDFTNIVGCHQELRLTIL